jgi:GT2 family glycosyltransferase
VERNEARAGGRQRRRTVCAILTSHNRRELTLRCLGDLFGQECPDTEITAVLVDDGSTDGTPDAVAGRFPQVSVVRADGTLWWATGMAVAEAEARRAARPDFLLWLNDDVKLAPDALTTLLDCHARTEGTPRLIAGAVCDPVTGRTTYGGVARVDWHPLRYRLVEPRSEPVRVDTVNGNVLLVPSSTYELLGSIDGVFVQSYADLDYGLRLGRLGGVAWLAPGHVGTCPRNESRHREDRAGLPWRARWSWLLGPKGMPPRSHLRYLRRHGGPAWPVIAALPYAQFVVRRRTGTTEVHAP